MAVVLVVRPEGLFPAASTMSCLAHPAQRRSSPRCSCSLRCCRSMPRVDRQHFPADAVHPHRHPGDRGDQPQPDHGLWRHGELRPCRLSRHRRLCGRHPRPGGHRSGFVQWPLALAVSALFALVIGALSLRTRGVYFIMITLAFAQMIYYVAVGLDRYGGDDGLTIYRRSQFGGLIDLSNKTVVLLPLPRAAAGVDLSRLAPRQFALRHGDPGRALERPAHARDRLPDLSLPARPASSSPARSAASPARCSPTTPTSSARR